MKFLYFLSFAILISATLAVDLNIRKFKGGGFGKSRGGSSTSRRSGSLSGGSSSSNSQTNLGGSVSGGQHSQSQGIQSHHQVDNLPKNTGINGDINSAKIDGSSGIKNNQNLNNGGSVSDGIGQMNYQPNHTPGLSSGVILTGMMMHNGGHMSSNIHRKNSKGREANSTTTTTQKTHSRENNTTTQSTPVKITN